jgi:hypothetical protein
MTSSQTFTAWLEALGLEVKEGGDAADDQVSVVPADAGTPGLVVQRTGADTWDVIHERLLPESVLTSDLAAAAREVACGFPLVEAEMHDDGGDIAVRFRAPVFEDGLTRQGFALTASAVLKAAQVFDWVLARRGESIGRYAGAGSETSATIETTPATPSVADAAPASGWSPTHVVARRADAWAQPDPAGPRAGTVRRRVPVQVTERRGDWARVVAENGWSGWIDSRELKTR